MRNDVIIPGVDQAALKKKLVRTGNAFFRRNADRNAPAVKLSLLVRACLHTHAHTRTHARTPHGCACSSAAS